MSSTRYTIRAAAPSDVPVIVDMIVELAEFEGLAHLLELTEDRLQAHLFGSRPVVEGLVGDAGGQLVGYALYFTNFSTFLGKPGLYLEDLYVRPDHRGIGLGKGLLQRLARIAAERDYGRFEWSVLDWNERAIGFYEKMGASLLLDWRICRMTGDALQRFADG